jgi:RNA polymerase sigma-70 factor (ECF subfamily)
MTNDEQSLFEKLRNGDETAFEVIYKRYAPRLFYFVHEYVPNREIAEDIIQDSLMALWNKRSTLNDQTNLEAYIFTIAKNNCLYKLRDRRYKLKLFETTDIDEPELKISLEALSVLDTSFLTFIEIEQIIERTFEQLPPQCRVVFRLSRSEEKKNKEIADELGISVKAVEAHISKALKLFRTALKDYLPIVAALIGGMGQGA